MGMGHHLSVLITDQGHVRVTTAAKDEYIENTTRVPVGDDLSYHYTDSLMIPLYGYDYMTGGTKAMYGAYKRTIAANRVSSLAIWVVLYHMFDAV